jgi:hypothetical protein
MSNSRYSARHRAKQTSLRQDLRKRGFNPLSLRERVRVRGLKNKAFFLIDPLIPTFSPGEKEKNA